MCQTLFAKIMSKPKQYDRNDLLMQAVELFRRQGYNGTSTAELAEALGINKKSMYSEFGSKEGLFDAALSYYNSNHLTWVLGALEKDNADLETIRKAFEGYASASEGAFRGLGCLLCNTAAERGSLPDKVLPHVDHYFERIHKAFQNALDNAREQNALKDTVEIHETANFLTTLMIGMSASIRAEAPPEQLWASYRVTDRLLNSLSN